MATRGRCPHGSSNLRALIRSLQSVLRHSGRLSGFWEALASKRCGHKVGFLPPALPQALTHWGFVLTLKGLH